VEYKCLLEVLIEVNVYLKARLKTSPLAEALLRPFSLALIMKKRPVKSRNKPG